GDSVTKRLSSIYLVPNYTGDYTLRAAALLPYDENPSDDTISYIGHCYKRADTSDVFVLSVRPSCPDTADGYTLVKPVVRIGRSDNIHSKDCQITVSLRLLDSNRNTKADVFNVVNMSPDDTADVLFLQTIQVPDYDGCYYLIATVKSDWNVVSSNDTMEYKCYCYYRPDTADVEFIWAKPHMDTLEGKNMIYVDAKMRYYTNKGTLPSYVDVSPEVLIYDSAGSLVGYYGGYYSYGFHIKNNETKEERLWQNHYTYLFVPDYDGYYYLEAYIAKDPNCNTVISNDTVIYKAYCTKHHFVDVELVSVRPQVDSAFGHSLNTPVVTVRNVGDLGANNIALSVIVMTSGWKIIASLVDTIPYLAAGDSLVKKFTAFYRTPDYSGTYIMQASHTTYKDEYNGHDDAEYRARCIKHPDSADVRLVYISYPSSDQVLNGGFSFMPEIKVELAGSNYDSVKNLHFIAELYDDKGRFVDSSSVLETQSVWKVGDNMRILFPSLFLPNYPDSCRLKIYYDSRIPDPNHRNDTLEMVVRCSYTVDLEVSKLLHPLKDSVLRGGSIVFPKIRITNYARHDVDTVMVCYQLLNWKKEVWDSVREFVGSVEANDDEDFLLTNGYNVPNYNGYYYIKVWAECAHLDVKSANDTLLVKLNAYRFDTVDVMPVEFVQLADTLWGGSRVSPVLKLINNSAMDLNGLGVWMEAADSAGRVIRAWEERDISIQSGNTIKLQCSQSFVIPNYTGDYRLRAAVSYYPKNYALRVHDTLSRCFQIRHSDTIDVGLAELCYPASAEVLPGNTEVKPQVRVVNRSNVALDGLELTACVYDQAGLLHDSIMGNISEIGSDSQVVFEFPTAYRVPNASGSYSLKVQLIAPAGDVSSKDNQILCQLLSKMNKDVDLQLLSVSLSDTGLLKGDAWVHPIVRVTNLLPNKEVEKVKVFVNAYDSSKLLSSLSGEIARIGITDTVELVFADTFQIPNYTGSFYVKAYLQADWNETDFSNDTLTAAFRCQGTDAVREAVEPVWQLGQNIPNPAGMRTVIPFYLPQEANVTLSVFGVNGQLLFSKEIHAMAGGNVYELDVNNMASGIYYYAMEYKGQRLVKKMQIVK
ncbi:MAG: T9SS type A sorting domain-containing protein, partial [Bacteroidales bacterium]|nr:T9SS type A sorting domain-containing protein [Bacteroidales bacterium]